MSANAAGSRETSFFTFAQETDRCHAFNMTRYQDMLSGVVLLSFGYLGEVNQLCTQFVKIRTAVTCPLVGGPTTVL